MSTKIERLKRGILEDAEKLKRIALDLWWSAPLALLGVGCYFLSGFMDNLWRFAGDLLWLAPEYIPPAEPPSPESVKKTTLSLRLFQFSATTMRAFYCIIIACMCTWLLRHFSTSKWRFGGCILAALMWWILAIAETFSIVEYILCKMVADDHSLKALSLLWELEGQTSSCERLGGPILSWAPLAITSIAMLWVLWRAYQVWRNMTPKPTAG